MTEKTIPAAHDDRYKKLFSEMIDGFVLHEAVCDENGRLMDYRFLEVNDSFERITGLSSSHIVGRTVRTVFPKTGSFLMEIFETVALTGTPQIFERYAHDLDRHLKISAYRPDPDLLACVVVDISAHKRVEDSLRESEATFRAHVENSFDVIFTLDAAGTSSLYPQPGSGISAILPATSWEKVLRCSFTRTMCPPVLNILHKS